MTDLENRIYSAISSAKNGIKGSEIALQLGVEKKLVNSTLANSSALKAVVTQDNNYKWHLSVQSSRQNAVGSKNAPEPDNDLRAICNYYLSCLSLESSSSVSQYLVNQYGNSYAVLNGLCVDPVVDSEAIHLLNRISGNRDKKAYLGYPSRIYTFHGRSGLYKKIAPVFLFPVEYVGGQVEISSTPSINIEILKAYANNGSDALANELVQLEHELGMDQPDADIEIDELVYRLRDIRQWDWAELIDPYDIPPADDISDYDDGIYNCPVIIEAEREKYTQGLESELMTLSNMPEENYRGTALHSWIKGDFSAINSADIKPLLEVLPLNSEQAQAVETALRSDLTIVTGPPGTGKSQVVTDLLVNIAWNGKSALFSSKNNKAVDVVDARVNGLCRRPVLLRIGGFTHAGKLAEIIEGLLNAQPNRIVQSDLEYYKNEYNKLLHKAEQYRNSKTAIIQARNLLDENEQNYCSYRHIINPYFDVIDISDKGAITSSANDYAVAYNRAIKSNNGFFARLFWSSIGPKREEIRKEKAAAYNQYAGKYGLTLAADTQQPSDVVSLVSNAEEFENALVAADSYKNALSAFATSYLPLESIDKQIAENKKALADIAFKLWDKWLNSQAITFDYSERAEMADFVATMKLAGGIDLTNNSELKRQFTKMTKQMMRYLQCWAVTSLSAKSHVPFTAGVFDYVIIDEASQCDIASILPLLYRAKHAVIIGDPKQLKHISQLSRQQDLALLTKYRVPAAWSYSANSLYDLASSKVNTNSIVQLKDHFRSCSDIIEFSNEVFYDGSLRTATKYATLKTPRGEKPGIRWIDIKGTTIRPNSGSAYNAEEAAAVVCELQRLISNGYTGTIGATTPFRRQAAEIQKILENQYPELYDTLLRHHEFIVDTVHKFQGDERDLMIFSPVVTKNTPTTTLGFLSNTGNLFNVAITRARAVLVVVGDYQFCSSCTVDYLKKFAHYCNDLTSGINQRRSEAYIPDSREYPWVANPEQVSDWEKLLYTALYDAGITTIPQYPADKYKLDLAIIMSNGRKLDIEVDGEMYHRQWDGELCYRDQLRNQRMFELGWDVKRFWVYQIRDEMPLVIEQIRNWVNNTQ